MKQLTILIAFFFSVSLQAQNIPYGTYYSLPRTRNADAGIFDLKKFSITKDSVVEEFVHTDLKSKGEDGLRFVYKIDSVIKQEGKFIFIYSKDYHYEYLIFEVDKKNTKSVLSLRDNALRLDHPSINSVLQFIKQDTLPPTYFPLYDRKTVLAFASNKPVSTIDSISFLSVLVNITNQMKMENAIRGNLKPDLRDKYAISRFHGMSYLAFFLEQGYNPFITNEDRSLLKKRFYSNYEIRPLFKMVFPGVE
jgi:hypothetical protein